MRKESDSHGEIEVSEEKLWGAQTQRSLKYFSVGSELMPREMITAYAVLKKASATANHQLHQLSEEKFRLITQVCDELLGGSTRTCFLCTCG